MSGSYWSMSDYDIKLSENEWHLSCFYDEEEESVNLDECLALFQIEVKYGWDASLSPAILYQEDVPV